MKRLGVTILVVIAGGAAHAGPIGYYVATFANSNSSGPPRIIQKSTGQSWTFSIFCEIVKVGPADDQREAIHTECQ